LQSELRVAEISEDTADNLKKFKFRKSQNTVALICCPLFIKYSLPYHQPRYILLSYRYEKEDGRVTFPYCLLFSTPMGMWLYRIGYFNLLWFSIVYLTSDLEELSDEWLQENLDRTT
ncbi:unnamed protein product, partial [Schistosoma margrebowiei]